LSFQESSTASHANDWSNGIKAFFESPWGSGLGTTDQTALRDGLKHITGDNLYLKYAVEMGFVGITLFVAILCSIGSSAMRLYRHGKTLAEQRMGVTLWLAVVGIAINGVTAVVFNSIALGWLFFWLAGAVVTVSERRSASSIAVAREPMPVGLNPVS
jgi:O-antigen ligase